MLTHYGGDALIVRENVASARATLTTVKQFPCLRRRSRSGMEHSERFCTVLGEFGFRTYEKRGLTERRSVSPVFSLTNADASQRPRIQEQSQNSVHFSGILSTFPFRVSHLRPTIQDQPEGANKGTQTGLMGLNAPFLPSNRALLVRKSLHSGPKTALPGQRDGKSPTPLKMGQVYDTERLTIIFIALLPKRC